MPRIFRREIVVPAEAIDELGHVSNIVYVRWMQDVATAHSAAQGWPLERLLAIGSVWVAASHAIRYRRPALLGETVTALTWVAEIRHSASRRRTVFRRAPDGAMLAEAETLWAFVDRHSGRPKPLPEEVRSAFTVIPPAEEADLRRH